MKDIDVTTQKWFKLGFTDKHHYSGWLHFNGLVEEEYTYDDVYYDEYTGTIVNIQEYEHNETGVEEYVKSTLDGKIINENFE